MAHHEVVRSICDLDLIVGLREVSVRYVERVRIICKRRFAYTVHIYRALVLSVDPPCEQCALGVDGEVRPVEQGHLLEHVFVRDIGDLYVILILRPVSDREIQRLRIVCQSNLGSAYVDYALVLLVRTPLDQSSLRCDGRIRPLYEFDRLERHFGLDIGDLYAVFRLRLVVLGDLERSRIVCQSESLICCNDGAFVLTVDVPPGQSSFSRYRDRRYRPVYELDLCEQTVFFYVRYPHLVFCLRLVAR